MRRVARRLGSGLLIAAALFIAAAILTARRGDPALWPAPLGAPVAEVFVVSHGYHAGIVVPRRALLDAASRYGLAALIELSTRFAAYDALEIGWGDEGFYREVPTATSLTLALALRALFRPGNPSVLHVVGINDPRATFAHSDLVRIELGEGSFARLAEKLDATFARDGSGRLEELGRGLYGPSLFFRAKGTFHIFNVCNHWLAGLLDAAGIPTAPVLATLPFGLLADLEWRSGLKRLPAPK